MCEPMGRMSDIVLKALKHLSAVDRNTAAYKPRHRAGATVAVVTVAMTLLARCDVSTCAAASSFPAGLWTA